MEKQLFGEDDTCLECFSSRVKIDTLELNYTSCCGRAICVPCRKLKFKKKNVIPCGSCGVEIKESSIGKDNLDAQRFESGKRVFNRVTSDNMQLTRRFFESDSAYNDYLEEVQDLVYMTVYGDGRKNKDEIEAEVARKQQALKQKAQKLFVLKSKSRDLDRQHREQIRKEGEHGMAAQPTYQFANEEAGPMPLSAETFDQIRARKKTEDDSLRAKVKSLPSDKRSQAKNNYLYTRNIRRTLAKLAGGFDEQYNRSRNMQAAFGV